MTIRKLLSRAPVSVNEVLDLFEAYVSTIGTPLSKATNLIRDELDSREGDIFGHIVGMVDDADQMAKQLRQIRAARNSGTDVTIITSKNDALRLDGVIREIDRMLSAAGNVLELLHDRAASEVENKDSGAGSHAPRTTRPDGCGWARRG